MISGKIGWLNRNVVVVVGDGGGGGWVCGGGTLLSVYSLVSVILDFMLI